MKVHGRTNILNGLTKVLEILKQDKKSENNSELMEEMRAEITMLLSDEYDNDFNTEEIVIEVKIIIMIRKKFSIHTHIFGYGEDYYSKLMSK